MAARRNPYYSTNGTAAYDVYARNTAFQPAQEPVRRELPDEQPLPQKHQRVRAKMAVAPFTLFGAAAAACMMILVIFGYVQLFEATSRVSVLERRLQTLQDEQLLLQSRYDAKIDLADIEQKAGELGLQKPSQEQIVYVSLTGEDRAELHQTEKSSILGEIISAVEQSVSELIAYLRPQTA